MVAPTTQSTEIARGSIVMQQDRKTNAISRQACVFEPIPWRYFLRWRIRLRIRRFLRPLCDVLYLDDDWPCVLLWGGLVKKRCTNSETVKRGVTEPKRLSYTECPGRLKS